MATAPAGRVVGDYVVGKQELGRGTFGKVYLGIHTLTKTLVAAKKFTWEKEYVTEKTDSEAHIMLAIPEHENLVKLLDYKKIEKTKGKELVQFWLILEYFPIGNLKDLVQKKPLSIYEKITLSAQCARAVLHLHSQVPSIVHRDIKPNNILVAGTLEKPIAKLADFGDAMAIEKVNGRSKSIKSVHGTGPYMAPEMFTASPSYTKSADVFSLGVTLLDLLEADTRITMTKVDELALGKHLNDQDEEYTYDITKPGDSRDVVEVKCVLADMLLKSPNYRSTIQQVVERFNNLSLSHADPISLNDTPCLETPAAQNVPATLECKKTQESLSTLGSHKGYALQESHHDLHEASLSPKPQTIHATTSSARQSASSEKASSMPLSSVDQMPPRENMSSASSKTSSVHQSLRSSSGSYVSESSSYSSEFSDYQTPSPKPVTCDVSTSPLPFSDDDLLKQNASLKDLSALELKLPDSSPHNPRQSVQAASTQSSRLFLNLSTTRTPLKSHNQSSGRQSNMFSKAKPLLKSKPELAESLKYSPYNENLVQPLRKKQVKRVSFVSKSDVQSSPKRVPAVLSHHSVKHPVSVRAKTGLALPLLTRSKTTSNILSARTPRQASKEASIREPPKGAWNANSSTKPAHSITHRQGEKLAKLVSVCEPSHFPKIRPALENKQFSNKSPSLHTQSSIRKSATNQDPHLKLPSVEKPPPSRGFSLRDHHSPTNSVDYRNLPSLQVKAECVVQGTLMPNTIRKPLPCQDTSAESIPENTSAESIPQNTSADSIPENPPTNINPSSHEDSQIPHNCPSDDSPIPENCPSDDNSSTSDNSYIPDFSSFHATPSHANSSNPNNSDDSDIPEDLSFSDNSYASSRNNSSPDLVLLRNHTLI